MKKMKKALAFVAAAALALSLTGTALAADVSVHPLRPYDTSGPSGTPDGTIDSYDTDYLADHTFNLYQIFTGQNSGSILTNIDWGSAVKYTDSTTPANSYDYGTVSNTSTSSDNLIMYLANLTNTVTNEANGTTSTTRVFPGLSNSGATPGSVTVDHLTHTNAAKLAEYLASDVVANDTEKVNALVAALEDFFEMIGDDTTKPAIHIEGKIEGTDTTTGVATGYYMVVDATADTNGDINALNRTLLQVVGDKETLEIQAKTDMPDVSKDIWEDTSQGDKAFPGVDSTGDTTWDFSDSATANKEGDYELNQDIPFRLYSEIPDMSYFTGDYKYIFRDNMSDGLTLKTYATDTATSHGNFKVSIQNKAGKVIYVLKEGEDEDYTITVADDSTTSSFVEDFYVTIPKLNEVFDAARNSTSPVTSVTAAHNAGWRVVVEYQAYLNENAIVGNNGNPNDVYLEYSNNPNGEGTGITEQKRVWAFTYGLNVDKYAMVDNEKTYLDGAQFVLYKLDSTGGKLYAKTTQVAKTDANGNTIYTFTRTGETEAIYVTKVGDNYYVYDTSTGLTTDTLVDTASEGTLGSAVQSNKITGWVDEDTAITTTDGVSSYTGCTVFTGKSFEFDGLDEQDEYYLKEIKAPTSEYNLLSYDMKLILDAEIAMNENNEERITSLTLDVYNGDTAVSSDIEGNVNTGHVTLEVENKKGSTLPQTGASGTMMAVIVGSVVMVGAAVFIITRKKMSIYED